MAAWELAGTRSSRTRTSSAPATSSAKRGRWLGRPVPVGLGKGQDDHVGHSGADRRLRGQLLGAPSEARDDDEPVDLAARARRRRPAGRRPRPPPGPAPRRARRRHAVAGQRLGIGRGTAGPVALPAPHGAPRDRRRAAAAAPAPPPTASGGPSRPGLRSPESSRPSVMACTASRSATSFQRSPEWPFTQVKRTSLRWRTASMNGSQRSRLATGLRCELCQPRPQPALPPAVPEAVHDVGGVAAHLEPAGVGVDGLRGGGDLHPLVGGVAHGPGGEGAVGLDPRPATRTRVAAARPVGVDDGERLVGQHPARG